MFLSTLAVSKIIHPGCVIDEILVDLLSACQLPLCYNQFVLQHCLVRSWIELAVVTAETLFVPVPNVQCLFRAAARMERQ